jgi:PAS domain S-box-containing protein
MFSVFPNSDGDLLELITDALVGIDRDGNIVFWGKSAETMLGYTRAEAVGRNFAELVIPADRVQEHIRTLREVFASGAPTYESVRRKKDGSLIYVDVTFSLVHRPPLTDKFVLSSEKDVTRLKVMRSTMLLRSRFGNLTESMPDAIIMADATGRIVLVNTQTERLFGYDRLELLGNRIEVLLPVQGHREGFFADPLVRQMGAGLELHGKRKDGTEFPVEIKLSPIDTEDGMLALSAIRDITERKRSEMALREKNVELADAIQAKDRFLATMSHELRTPMNAIIGFAGTLLMKLPGPLNRDQEKQLNIVRTSAGHLLALINDLLDLSKIEAGKVDLTHEPTACAEVLHDVENALRLQAEAKGLGLHVTTPERGCIIRTDRRALNQIVLNLANNAIKFSDSGTIELGLANTSIEGKPGIELTVTDTGVGIRADDQARLFEAFTRLGTSSERNREGTGLGLHLSQKLAGLLGGRIACRSEFGSGSTFTLSLPEG